jgi:hypothetical protein
MKTSIKTVAAALLILSTVACQKQNLKPGQSISANDANASTQALVIGQEYQGGIIIYIDSTGLHGIIAAKSDQSIGAAWYNGAFGITGATGKNLGTGPYNTRKIIRAQGDGIYAAKVCADYRPDEVYNDWYLPSKNELAEVYKQKAFIGAGPYVYWSSTEYDTNGAWAQNFSTGGRKKSSKDRIYHVRAVRTF